MSSSFSKTVGIACISMLFQFGVQAQNPTTSQAPAPKSSTSSGNTSSTSISVSSSSNTSNTSNAELKNQLALVSDRASDKALDKASSKAVSEVKTETRVGATIVEPKLWLKNPSIQFNVNPSESKLSGRPFANPSLEIPGAPASFHATAYALRGRTRSGAYVRRGVIAADPRVIPLGSVVQIKTPGYSGVYTVHDTGGRIKGKVIDVWVESPREARIFGRRQVKLHVLRLGPKPSSDK